MKWLEPNPHLPEDLIWIPNVAQLMAQGIVERIDDGPELAAGLRKLLEAKDCFVRAMMETRAKSKEQ
jgi:hypothetical protein